MSKPCIYFITCCLFHFGLKFLLQITRKQDRFHRVVFYRLSNLVVFFLIDRSDEVSATVLL